MSGFDSQVVASNNRNRELTWPRRVEALEVPRRKLPREALVLATDEKSRDDITYEFLSL